MKYGPNSYFELGAVFPRSSLRETIRRKRHGYKRLPIQQLIDPRVEPVFIYVLDAYGRTVKIPVNGVIYVRDSSGNTVNVMANDVLVTLPTKTLTALITDHHISIAITATNTFRLGN